MVCRAVGWDQSSKHLPSFLQVCWDDVFIDIEVGAKWVRLTASFKTCTTSFGSVYVFLGSVWLWSCTKELGRLGSRNASARLPGSHLINSVTMWFLIVIPSLLSAFTRCEDPDSGSSMHWQLPSSLVRVTEKVSISAAAKYLPPRDFAPSFIHPIFHFSNCKPPPIFVITPWLYCSGESWLLGRCVLLHGSVSILWLPDGLITS